MTKIYSYYLFDVAVAYREDVDEVMTLLVAIGEELRQDVRFREDILEALEMLVSINSPIRPLSSSVGLKPDQFNNGEWEEK